ncbi:CLUMA_CG008549, isoform A [Clunio marinus]|uniref:CLUMA_CG008549, isoform A n=1 Tax=Clunio marinus TaxID=568069 RepID=A0A1J1I404_9DIPT|nr:CLUMA_CG008549, isoform A [Clunio marinus]
MFSTSDLQALIDKVEGAQQGVDLVKIGQAFLQQAPARSPRRMRVALDIEGCLDRFYGGYYSDWACGGQFNRCFEFVQLLANAFQSAQMEVIVFFDGTLKENKKLQLERNDFRQKTISVLKHIRMIGTPPPKIWWLPPSGLKTCIRNALRTVEIPVVQTIHDHTMEVIDYYNEHKLNGIIGLHPDYIVCNVSRYFSSHDMRLSYKGALETKEFIVSQVLNHIQLIPEQLAIVAVLLGGYILIDDPTMKVIYQKLDIEYNQDFEARIRQLSNLVRSLPAGSNVDAIISHLNLVEFNDVLKESIEYYQRKGIFGGKRYLGSKKKPITEIIKNIDVIQDATPMVPMASETNENDEIANKILKDVNNLVNENEPPITASTSQGQEIVRKCVKFVYSLPAEVLRTSYQRHQRGSMDPRIYILLTKKEILLPQVLEDEQYREMPSVNIFYRPARQMIYAVLFNLYHQKYMCSKTKDNLPMPDVVINEWIWSPQNEYKKAEEVYAIQLPWAVPTIQRLWFGTTFDDKHRRMRAFLTVMRSDTAMMLNRNYVPQHLIVLACVLRYMVTNPDRNVLSRHELDAFLVTAFSPQLANVEYTQEMVLPGVYLRGVFLATLFMQGIETAQLANDACGVPLPWNLTNPWLFFDGKLFHLKLRMAVCLQNLRELCDDQLEMVMKIERFRKAILEDVENMVPPVEPMYRQMYQTAGNYQQSFGKNIQYPLVASNNYGGYVSASPIQQQHQQQMFYNPGLYPGGGQRQQKNQLMTAQQNVGQKVSQRGNCIPPVGYQKNNGYQLKVGGVVVGSWANGSRNPQIARMNRAGVIRYPINQRSTRGGNYRYRIAAPGSMSTSGFNQKSPQRFAKQKKLKPKKENNKTDDKNEENDVEKKTILKDDVDSDGNENGDQSQAKEEVVESREKVPQETLKLENDDHRNGTSDDGDKQQCDKIDEQDTTATDVLSSNAVDNQQQQNNKNGKNSLKKIKKNTKGKLDSPTSEEASDVTA